MALKKSELYSSLWASCDELRGGMDASQYKDYVLVLLFIKYISDKYAGQPFAPITIPEGASFADMVKLKGSKDIGDQINKTIIAPLAEANEQLSQADFPDFNDPNKLGNAKEMVDRLTNLIGIFQRKELDFSKNRADGDDILGDAYEYLMRHFATESGKSKGQFYTPAEVSRIMAKVIGIGQAKTSPDTTVYDPTCGSGSLLLKVADEASTAVSLYGQEKDSTTSGLARMNMILHNYPTAEVQQGNTLADPHFKGSEGLKRFDYIVANPPFSDKRWSTGLDPENDHYSRFEGFGVPPGKQGDYAYLLHIISSLKSSGKGACILPHGVLFRGNAEGAIRKNLIRSGFLKGIIGLPANLFYGTGIPACILVLDKEHATARKGIFMVDASAGFIKDGNKNRLRSRDIHKIVDAFTKGAEIEGYSRMVPLAEIEKNDFNLNLPRYIDNREAEDIQDIEAHLKGGIPEADVEALADYWSVCPGLKKALFKPNRPGYLDLATDASQLKEAITGDAEFAAFVAGTQKHFATWRKAAAKSLRQLAPGCQPKAVIHDLSEGLLIHYFGQALLDPYAIYQHLMDYWAETLQDDVYLISADGWKAEAYRILEEVTSGKNKGKTKDKGWTCDLVPKGLIVARYFANEQAAIDAQQAELEGITAQITELEEEHGGEDGAFSELDKINQGEVNKRLKEIKGDKEAAHEEKVLKQWNKLKKQEAAHKKAIKEAEAALDAAAYVKYPELSEDEVKALVVDDKWLATLANAIHGEIERIEQTLTGRVKELADRYATPLPAMTEKVAELETKVAAHLEKDGIRMELKPGYNQTEVGVIPEDWECLPLGELLSSTQLGGNYPNSERPTRWPLIKMGNLARGSIKLQKLEYVTPSTLPSQRDRLTAGDVLFNTRNTLDLVGKVAIWRDELPKAYFNSNIMRLKFDERKVSSNMFMNLILNTPQSLSSLRGIAIGTTSVAAIYNRDLFTVSVPVPSKPEQEAIAEALSDADALIDSLEQLIAKKRLLKQGAMQDLLTGNQRLPGFEGQWEVKTLGDLASVSKGTQLHSSETDDVGEFAHLNGGITPSSYTHKSNTVGNTIAISEGGNSCGYVQFMAEPYWCGGHCYSVVPNSIDNLFLYHALKGKQSVIMGLRVGSGLPNVQKTALLDFKLRFPATLPEQTAIAAILSDMDIEIAVLETKLAKTRKVKQGMMQELLTGKTRLV